MIRPNNRKELEILLRKFFDIDKRLPRVGHNKGTDSPLWKFVIIPDDYRSPEDVLEDLDIVKVPVTADDLEIWEICNHFLVLISGIGREVVIKRCQGMGWKRIAGHLVKRGFSKKRLSRQILWRYFSEGLDEILRKI